MPWDASGFGGTGRCGTRLLWWRFPVKARSHLPGPSPTGSFRETGIPRPPSRERSAMQILPIDLTSLVAVILGISIVLVPVAGLTARYVLKPVVDALGRFQQGRTGEETLQLMDRRMSLLEAQMEGLQHSVDRLVEVSEFNAELRSPRHGGELPPGGESG